MSKLYCKSRKINERLKSVRYCYPMYTIVAEKADLNRERGASKIALPIICNNCNYVLSDFKGNVDSMQPLRRSTTCSLADPREN